MIQITENLFISENDLRFSFIHAGGPGGQKVNKTASAVQLNFNIASSALPEEVKSRLFHKLSNQITKGGDILIFARVHRSQDQNRQEAVRRLVNLLKAAMLTQKKRKKTRPTQSSNYKRLESKHKRSEIKRSRRAGYEE
ncbi:MAG: alternative ribosome rescue aminoacyl-tRNA hydrolase ArfB [Planctomycetota bacterium]|jgi:ribosome-associated protein